MNNAPSTSSAVDTQVVNRLAEISKQQALEKAAQSEARVSDLGKLQKKSLAELLGTKGAGTDGASTDGTMEKALEPLLKQAEAKIDEDQAEIVKAIKDTPDAHVFKRTDTMAAYQDDADKSVGLGHDAFHDMEDLERRSKHERSHQEEESGDVTMNILKTGDATIDAHQGEITRGAMREDRAIDAEGGLKDHVPEYVNHVKTATAIAKHLNEAGEQGDKLVENAALTNKGAEELQVAMNQVTIRREMDELMKNQPTPALEI